MRVALNGLFLGRTDGTGRYTHGLLSASAGLDEPAWEVIALAGAGGSIEPRPRRLNCRSIRPPAALRGENLVKLWFEQSGVPRAAAEARADLLHYPYFAAPLRSPARLVVTIHDLIPLVLREYRG